MAIESFVYFIVKVQRKNERSPTLRCSLGVAWSGLLETLVEDRTAITIYYVTKKQLCYT